MMHRGTRIRALIALIFLAAFVAACGAGAAPTATPEPPAPTPIPPTSTPEPPTPTPEPEMKLPGADGQEVLDYVLKQAPYTEWGTWPKDKWNDFSQFLVSGEPHGSVVRIFVNDVALKAAAAPDFSGVLPAGSVIVKENYMGTDPNDPGKLAALTIMTKVEGFNPDANDWFWVKAKGDGSGIDKEGAVAGCIACHGQEGNHDFLMRYGFGEEPAVPTLRSEETDESMDMGQDEGESMGDPAAGQAVAQEAGCLGCHSIDGSIIVGPSWKGLWGKTESLEGGGTVVVDADYIRESIKNPPAKIVAGFPNAMPPNIGDNLSDEDIANIIAFIQSLQ